MRKAHFQKCFFLISLQYLSLACGGEEVREEPKLSPKMVCGQAYVQVFSIELDPSTKIWTLRSAEGRIKI
jgi:hypothetical protein